MHQADAVRPGLLPLFGRAGDLSAMTAFLAAAAEHGGGLLVTGDPGVGRSAVLAAASEAAAVRGVRAVCATGSGLEQGVSFSGLDQLLTPLRADFSRLTTDHRAAVSVALGLGDGPAPRPLVVSTATLSLLRLAAEARPVLLVVDDAQWLDHSTALVLGFVARRLAGSRVGLLAALRAASGSPLTQAGLAEHRLSPLDGAAASRFLSARFPSIPHRVRGRVLAEAEGNPLALEELPAALTARQRADEDALPAVLPLGRRLGAVFAARVHELPRETRELLLLAALHGSGDLSVLAAASAGEGGLDGLAPAERAGLVSTPTSSGRLVFSHPLVRSAVVESSTAVERRRAHRALAAALHHQPDHRAWHLAEATLGTDEQVAGLLAATARTSLRRGDALRAVAALSRAAELSPAPEDRSRRHAESAYMAADVTGELRSAARLLDDGADRRPAGDGSLQAVLAASYLALDDGDVIAAHRLLVTALGRLPEYDGPSRETVVEALHRLLLVCFYAARPELWAAFDQAVGRLGGPMPDTLRLCSAALRDPVRRGSAVLPGLTAALGGLSQVVDPTRIVRTGMAAVYLDRLSGCREALWRVVEDGRRGGAVASAIDALLLLSVERLQAGAWSDAEQLAEEAVRLTESRGYRLLRWPGRLTQALVAAARGEEATVRALCDEMAGWAGPRGVGVVEMYAAHARGLAALGRGDFETAYRWATAVSPPGTFAPDLAPALWVALDLVDAAVHTGRRAEARAHVAAMRDAGVAELSPRSALVVAAAAALAAEDDAAGPLFAEALALPHAVEWPFELARVRLAHGEHLRRVGAAAAARRQLATARDGFAQLGAHPWAARAGGRPWSGHPLDSADRTVDGTTLTVRELEIARLAATGLTNKQIADRLFLSPRTVGANLYRLFPKVEVTSRSALGQALAERFPASVAAESSP